MPKMTGVQLILDCSIFRGNVLYPKVRTEVMSWSTQYDDSGSSVARQGGARGL